MKQGTRYLLFLGAIPVLSVPFYYWGYAHPVAGLPFGLPISFLMILVPFTLALIVTWKSNGAAGVTALFKRILDFQNVRLWPLVFTILGLPAITCVSYWVLRAVSVIPVPVLFPYNQIPLMVVLYFLGAIPEEVAWTLTLTEPLTKSYGPIGAGILIGGVWAIWHVIPWSWTHTLTWILGYALLDILMRTGMVHAYLHGGKSLFLALVLHMQINVCTTFVGPLFNPWLVAIGMLIIDLVIIATIRSGHPEAILCGTAQPS